MKIGINNLYSNFKDLTRRFTILLRYNNWTIAEYYRKQGAQIGDNCRIDINSILFDAHLLSIGNHVFIANHVTLHTHDGAAWILRDEIPNIRITGKIIIEDNCMIGASAHLFPNVRIGKNSIIGAGSVVISDIPPNSIAMGVPARVIGSTLKYRERHVTFWKEQVALNKQQPPDPQKDQKAYPL